MGFEVSVQLIKNNTWLHPGRATLLIEFKHAIHVLAGINDLCFAYRWPHWDVPPPRGIGIFSSLAMAMAGASSTDFGTTTPEAPDNAGVCGVATPTETIEQHLSLQGAT